MCCDVPMLFFIIVLGNMLGNTLETHWEAKKPRWEYHGGSNFWNIKNKKNL